MLRPSKIWLVMAVLFTLVNAAGGVFAVVHGEVIHAAVHAALVLLGEYAIWWLSPRRLASN